MVEDKPQDDKPKKKRERPKLGMSCTSTNCKDGKHYFGPDGRKDRRKRRGDDQNDACTNENNELEHCNIFQPHGCRECGAAPVDWIRLHKRDITGVAYTISSLKVGCWQHHWWEKAVDAKAVQEAKNRGRARNRIFAERRLRTEVGCEKVFRDGVQTPLEGDIVFYAQHATATCCRKCLSYWHGIPPGREMTEQELNYCTELVMAYVDVRLPALTEEGTVLCLPL